MRYLICFLVLVSLPSFAIVDIRSAGYSKTFVDFKSETKGFEFTLERTYNSRSLFNGLFGFGWCSNFETNLETLPDNSIKVTECGGGLENFYYLKNKSANITLQTDLILKQIQKKKIKMNVKNLKQLKKDLTQSQTLRADFLKALDIKGAVKKGLTYYRSGSSSEYITVTNNGYKRTLPNGIKEVFSNQGKITRFFDKNGNAIDIKWKNNFVQAIDNLGNKLSLNLDSSTKKVKMAKFNKKIKASYKFVGEDLMRATNSYKETFTYTYNSFHDLTQTTYPNKTTETIKYNQKKDWVVGFKDRKGCQESYKYAKNPKNPDHYFSTVEKKCGRKIVNKSKYEFWNKSLANGGKYLHRARAHVNGRLKTDIIYHPKFGSPVSFYKNGMRTHRTYYKNGFLRSKSNPYKIVEYKKYISPCGKPSSVIVKHKNTRTKKIVKTEVISFSFKPNCQLVRAKKSKDEWIKIGYDSRGRLTYMEDQSRKQINITWHKTLNKPETITRSGIGSIQVVYNKKGEVVDLKAGANSGPTIVSQVSSVFNSFLQTLAPVAEEMVIL